MCLPRRTASKEGKLRCLPKRSASKEGKLRCLPKRTASKEGNLDVCLSLLPVRKETKVVAKAYCQ
jgi:hypothetical protein